MAATGVTINFKLEFQLWLHLRATLGKSRKVAECRGMSPIIFENRIFEENFRFQCINFKKKFLDIR